MFLDPEAQTESGERLHKEHLLITRSILQSHSTWLRESEREREGGRERERETEIVMIMSDLVNGTGDETRHILPVIKDLGEGVAE